LGVVIEVVETDGRRYERPEKLEEFYWTSRYETDLSGQRRGCDPFFELIMEVVGDDECAHVIDATAEQDEDGSWTFSVTVLSDDTGWDKYADLWELRDPLTGDVLDSRMLLHPHETEQPFKRSLSGVEIPEGTDTVVIAARDSVVGFCGTEFTLDLSTDDPTPNMTTPAPSTVTMSPSALAPSSTSTTSSSPTTSHAMSSHVFTNYFNVIPILLMVVLWARRP